MTRQLPLTPAALGSLAGVLVVTAAVYFGLVWPSGREVTRLQTQLTALSAQVAAAAQSEPVTDVERASWQTVEQRVRERFVVPDDQRELMVDLAQLARSSGMAVLDLQLEGLTPGAVTTAETPVSSFAMPVPPTLAPNPGVIRLSVRHQYRALIDFLDRLATGDTYVAVQALDVRRVENLLQSEIRIVSFRWVAP